MKNPIGLVNVSVHDVTEIELGPITQETTPTGRYWHRKLALMLGPGDVATLDLFSRTAGVLELLGPSKTE